MKTDNLRESSQIEDRRGQSSHSRGGTSFGGAGSLLNILFSGGSFQSKLVMLLVILFLGGSAGFSGIFGDLLGGGQAAYQTEQVSTQNGASLSDEKTQFVSKVLATTEDYWTETFQKEGLSYTKPRLVFYTGQTQTGCGIGQASAGPFYCPADQKIYLDISFYNELSNKYKAKGDFAMAYVIAHEVGHHVQNELGTMSQYNKERRGLSEAAANALNVRLELQADYYAGAWANYVQGEGLLEAGDVEEAMTAAHAVGDDTLQKDAYGYAVPEIGRAHV